LQKGTSPHPSSKNSIIVSIGSRGVLNIRPRIARASRLMGDALLNDVDNNMSLRGPILRVSLPRTTSRGGNPVGIKNLPPTPWILCPTRLPRRYAPRNDGSIRRSLCPPGLPRRFAPRNDGSITRLFKSAFVVNV
jgi:hypothetical protein